MVDGTGPRVQADVRSTGGHLHMAAGRCAERCMGHASADTHEGRRQR
ncbi:hypothetical protein G9274_000136 [Stenotrophomonas rhizophila]|nr:hypothetical protein G9274_000136 [Stenotrophomonas rhizophila]